MSEAIVVAGARSNAGKTSLASWIVGNLPGRVAAIKTSISEGHEDIQVTADPAVTHKTGKDTQQLAAAGATPAVLLRASPADLEEALGEALSESAGADYLVVEGNRVLPHLHPELAIFLDAPGEEKPSAAEARDFCHLTVNGEQLRRLVEGEDNLAFSVAGASMSCRRAHLVARAFGAASRAVGDKFTAEGVKLRECQLGCF